MLAAHNPLLPEFGMYPRIAIAFIARVMHTFDLDEEPLITYSLLTRYALHPGMVTAWGNK